MIEINLVENPTISIIWLHGLGADGHDFVGITDQLGLEPNAPVRFIFPHAPIRPVTINMGMPMRAWYDIFSLTEEGREDRAGMKQSQKMMEELIASENERGVSTSRIFLAGFSQGAAVALYCGLRFSEQLAGVISLSGYLPFHQELTHERSTANKNTPVFWGHGVFDPVVQMAWGVRSRDALEALGYSVAWHEYAMEHHVCPQELLDIGSWINHRVSALDE